MNSQNQKQPVPLPDSLEAIRSEIDRLDDALLELLERRIAASIKVAALKQAEHSDRLRIRPAREAAIIERLTGRARHASPALVTQIWRAVMAHSVQTQVRMELVLCADGDKANLLRKVRTRFGEAAPVRWVEDAAEALDAARNREAVAIVAPALVDPAQLQGSISVFDAIRDGAGEVLALAIGRVAPEDRLLEREAAR
ncbi:MAG: chorismate mutase [Pseudomonadota bacterium]|nr:chorismate mutase [Pseudomonadota bacterium]